MSKATSKQPTHEIFVVENGGENDQGFWHKIGVAWQNEKGVITTKRFAIAANGEEVILPAGYKKDE